MTIFKKAALAAVVTGFAFASPAFAQSATQVSANGQATVKLYTPLSLQAVAGSSTLDFGILAANGAARAAAATFVMGGTSATPSLSCFTGWLCSGTLKMAKFTVAGTPGASVHVDVPTAAVTLSSGANTVNVTGFATDLSTPANTVLAFAATPFAVSGTLNVPANTPDGVYTGSFQVTADYN